MIAGVVALDQRGQRARRGDRRRRRSASAPRRSPTTTSTARCCSPARAWRSTTRRRRAATCSPRCCRSPAAIGVLRGDGDRLVSLALSPDDRTLAMIDIDGTLSCSTPARGVSRRARRCRVRPRRDRRRGARRDQSRRAALQRRRHAARRRRRPAGGARRADAQGRDAQARRLPLLLRRALLGRRAHACSRVSAVPGLRSALSASTVASGRPIGTPRSITQRDLLVTPMRHARREARRHHDARPYGDPRRDDAAAARAVARRRC